MKLLSKLFSSLLLILFVNCENDMDTSSELDEVCDYEEGMISPSSYHIILIMGQSNTNSGIGLDLEIDKANFNVKQLGRFDNDLQIIEAIPPLDHHTPSENRIGFGISFGNFYSQEILRENETLLLVPCGYGGSGFSNDQWNQGDELYVDAINRVNFIRQNFQNSQLKAILWHQGESDIDTANYEELLNNFISDFRNDVGRTDVPFIMGGMVPNWVDRVPQRLVSEDIIRNTASDSEQSAYVDPRLPFVIEKEDNSVDRIHFNAEGQREMGKRYYNEFKCVLSGMRN